MSCQVSNFVHKYDWIWKKCLAKLCCDFIKVCIGSRNSFILEGMVTKSFKMYRDRNSLRDVSDSIMTAQCWHITACLQGVGVFYQCNQFHLVMYTQPQLKKKIKLI